MTQSKKLIDKMNKKTTPSDVDFAEFRKYLELFGFVLDRTNGSHNIFVHPKIKESFPIPIKNGRTVKPYYITFMNKVIKDMEE